MAEIADAFETAKENLVSKQEYEAEPTDAFARAKRAQVLGVNLDTEAPVGQPGFLGGVADIGRGLAHGTISGLPKSLGQAAEFFGARETGKTLQQFGEEQDKAYPSLRQSQVGQIANAEDLSLRGGAYGAGENTPLSQGPALAGAAAGAGIGAIGGPAGALAGAGVGYVVGSLAALPVFYGSQAQETKEGVQKGLRAKGVSEAEVERQSNTAGHLSGAVEAGGELLADLIPFHALFNPLAKAVKGELVKSTLGNVGRKIAATTAGVVTAEVSTEMAQQALEDQIEKQYGGEGPGATWKSTLSVVVPTALMTLIPGGFVAAHNFRSNLQVKGALANPEADAEQRTAAAGLVFHSIKGTDPLAALAFDSYATNQIAAKKPIEIKDDAWYIQDFDARLKKPEDSAVDPKVGLDAAIAPPPTPAEKIGLDPAAGVLSDAATTAVNTGVSDVVQAKRAAEEGAEAAGEQAKAEEKQLAEAQKAGDQAIKEQDTQRKEAWAGLDERLKTFGIEAKAVAQKAKESAGEGEPQVPAIHKALTVASQANWEPAAAVRAMKVALNEKRDDIAIALAERAQRVAVQTKEAIPSVPADNGMYGPIQASLAKKAEVAQRVADKLAIMAKLQPETSNVQKDGATQAARVASEPPPTSGTGSNEQPAGGGTSTSTQATPVVGASADQQENPPDGARPQEAANAGETEKPVEPTPAQIEAGNYKKEHITAAGFPISVENKEGSTRRSQPGVEPAWEATIQKAHYGYIKRTEGADEEHVDAFVKPDTTPEHDGPVFVIDQQGADGKFDEHKVMLGYANQLEAVAAYKANYPKGWKVGPVTPTSNAELKAWLKDGDTTKPFTERKADPLAQLVDYDKLEETDDAGKSTGRYAAGKVAARDALADIENRLQFARAMRECLGV